MGLGCGKGAGKGGGREVVKERKGQKKCGDSGGGSE